MATCPNCGNTTGEGAIFCDRCGTRLPLPQEVAPEAAPAPAGGSVICPSCGAGNVPGEAFCDFCGSPLEAPVPAVQAVSELEPVSREAELEVAAEPAAPPAEVAAPPPGGPVCPACGEAVSADEAFCAACGASLALAPIPPEPVPEVEPEPVVVPVPVEPALPPAPPVCPACGSDIEAGDAFCSACGYALRAVPAPVPAVKAAAEPAVAGPAPTGPRLVVATSGAEIPLPAGNDLLVGREDPVSGIYPQVDLTPHGGEEGGVSRQHARIIVEGGSYFVEDLDSTNFTFVNKQKLAPKTRQPVGDGDEIRFGRVSVVLKIRS